LAGRKQFVRWALTLDGVQECQGFPGCSEGFQAIASRLDGIVRKGQVGPAQLIAMPLPGLVEAVQAAINQDALALLCDRDYCERCMAARDGRERPKEDIRL
jgi:aminoglycoside 3-N-acetyltransferase